MQKVPPKAPPREDVGVIKAEKKKPPPPPTPPPQKNVQRMSLRKMSSGMTDEEGLAQERILQFGIGLMLAGLLVVTAGSFGGDETGFPQLVGSTISVIGVVIASSAEIDINVYLTLSFVVRGGRLSFCLVFLVAMAFGAHAFVVSPASCLPALPMLYALVRFESVVNMQGGYFRFTQLVAISFVLSCLSWAIYYIQVALKSDPQPPFAFLSAGWLVSGIVLMQAYIRSAKRGASLTYCFYTALYWYLLFEGAWAYTKAYITTNCYSEENPAARSWITSDQHTVKDGEWAVGPVYAAAGLFMICFRDVVFGRLGRWWLRRNGGGRGASQADQNDSNFSAGARVVTVGHEVGAII
jgi:hypothetical protein